jgi:hypothetical protein
MPEVFNSNKTKAKKKKGAAQTEAEPIETAPKVTRHVDEYSTVMRREQPSNNPFKAFTAKPSQMFFEAQHTEEKVLLLLRQHPVTQVKWILVTLILIFVPVLFSYVPLLSFLPVRFHLVALLGWYMLVAGFALEAFLDWFFNVYIITDERVIDVDFYSLLFKNISYAKIDKIEDITTVTSGTLGAVFDFGTVKIQTAAATAELEFEHVPHPSKVTAFLNELLVEEERERIEGRVN